MAASRHRSVAALAAAIAFLLVAAPGDAAAAEPNDSLVVRLEAGDGLMAWGQVISIHADGRVISSGPSGQGRLTERRLNEAGVRLVRDAVDATGLFGSGAPPTARYELVLRAGAVLPGRGAYGMAITVGRGDAYIAVAWSPMLERDIWEPSSEVERLDALADVLSNLGTLPATAWADGVGGPYTPALFEMSDEEVWQSGGWPAVSVDDVAWPTGMALIDLPARVRADGLVSRCTALTPNEAAAVFVALGDALGYTPSGHRQLVELNGADGVVHRVRIEALMPDQQGCSPPMPDTAMGAAGGADSRVVIAALVAIVTPAMAVLVACRQRGRGLGRAPGAGPGFGRP